MRTSLISLYLVVALGGCETAPTYSSSPSEQMTVVHPGDAVSVLGTPFYLVGGRSAWASIAALSESYFAPAIQRGLGDGINQHCGPPYVLSPYRVVSVEPKVGVPETPAPEQPTRVPDVPAPPRSLDPAPGTPKNVDAGTAAEVTSRLLCRADDRTGPGAGCRCQSNCSTAVLDRAAHTRGWEHAGRGVGDLLHPAYERLLRNGCCVTGPEDVGVHAVRPSHRGVPHVRAGSRAIAGPARRAVEGGTRCRCRAARDPPRHT